MQAIQGIGAFTGSQQAVKARLATFSVGICATGNSPSLRPLVETILLEEASGFALRKVVLVMSECSEETLASARKIAVRDKRIKLIEHDRRAGKAEALNQIFEEAEGDYLVYVNADAKIAAGSIPALLQRIDEEEWMGFISGRPTFDGTRGVISGVLDVMWTSQNFLSSDPHQSKWSNHGTDELMVIRRGLLPHLPKGVVNDGAYIAGRVREMGYLVGFQPDAVVMIDVPRRMVDLLGQRRRILFGHIQVKRMVGKAPRTVETMMFFSPLQSSKIVVRMLARRPKRILFMPAAVVGELIALTGALWDTLTSSSGHAIWKRYGDE